MKKRPLPEHGENAQSTNEKSGQTSDVDIFESLTDRALITLPISSIQPYENNPRRRANPNYQKIKQSIARNGLIQPIVITRRPGHQNFIVYKGGNTRLQAIKELFEETGDYKFRFVECSFMPWSGYESDAIIGHLQENELRKSLCFIDKAVGIKAAIDHLQTESEDEETSSVRHSHQKLIERGYSVTLSSLSIMLYAVEMIEPNLSSTTCESMGRRSILSVRKLQNAFRDVCKEFDKTAAQSRKLFQQALIGYPEAEWDKEFFRRSLEANLAKEVSTSIQDVSLRIDGYLSFSSTPLHESFEQILPELEQFEQAQKHEAAHPKLPINSSDLLKSAKAEGKLKRPYGKLPEFKSITLGVNPPKQSDSENSDSQSQKPRRSAKPPQRSELELKLSTLRGNAYAAASQIGKQHSFLVNPSNKKRIIVNTGDWGIGYIVCDYPPPVELLNPTAAATREALWWLLVEFCDLQWATECARPATAKLIGKTDLLHFIKSGDPKSLISHAKGKMKCTFPHIGLIGFCLRQLDDESWASIQTLTESYRNLHHLANEHNLHLFRLSDTGGK